MSDDRQTNPAFLAHRHGIAHTDCWCGRCEHEAKEALFADGKIDIFEVTSCFMHLCVDCGDKRCPRALDHNNDCAGVTP